MLPLRPCFEGRQLELRPFAEGTSDAAELRLYRSVKHLDANTILAASDDVVAVIGRGDTRERWRELAISQFGLPVPPKGEIWRVADAAFSSEGPAARGVVSVSRAPEVEGPAEEGRIYALELGPPGLRLGRELWRSSTPSRRDARRIAELAFDAHGAWVGVGEGLVLSATAGWAAPSELPQSPAFDGLFVSHAGDEGRDFALAGRSFVRWFDPARGQDGLREVPLELATGPTRLIDDLRAHEGPGGASLQLLLFPPEIARRPAASGDWTFNPPVLDAVGPRCAHESLCGRRFASQRCEFVESWPAMSEQTSVVAPFQCGEIYLVDERAGCSISAPIGAGPDLGLGFDEEKIEDADHFGDHLTLVGERGRIFEVAVE